MGALVQLPTESYREILDHLPVATYLVDAARRIVLWNDACEVLTGHRREEVLGHFCANDLLAHCDESCVPRCGAACPIMETMRDGRSRQMDLFLRHKDGHRVPVRVRAAPVRNEHGAIVAPCESMDERPMSLPAASPPGVPSGTFFDPVTELPPRYILLDRVAAEVQAFDGDRVPFGVLALTIDNLSGLCAAGGSMGAGRVLLATARTMCRLVGAGNLIGRWDDGVFLAILHGCSEA